MKLQLKHIGHGYYPLPRGNAASLTIDGQLPRHGYEKRALPPEILDQRVQLLKYEPYRGLTGAWEPGPPINEACDCWIARTRHEGEEVWALVVHRRITWHDASPPWKPYPAIPTYATLFQHNYGWEEPTAIGQWQWTTTFGRWSALCTFKDGWHGYTYPKLKSDDPWYAYIGVPNPQSECLTPTPSTIS